MLSVPLPGKKRIPPAVRLGVGLILGRAGQRFERETNVGLREDVLDRTTGPYLAVVLKLMASSFNRRPDLRRELYQRHNGTLKPFDSRYQFRTADGVTNLYLTIEGRADARGTGAVHDPHLIATFRDSAALRLFFSPFSRSDPLNLLLDNRLSFEGNMSYLARLGHLTAVVRDRRWRNRWTARLVPPTWRTRRLDAGGIADGEATRDPALRADAGSRRPGRPLPQPLRHR